MTDEELTVTYKDNSIRLNARLITQKALSKMQVQAIKELHKQRMIIEEQLEAAHRQEDINYIYSNWTNNQFALQRAWGFPENANFHPSHRLPHCDCPKLDGDDRIGTPYKVCTVGCPIHDPT